MEEVVLIIHLAYWQEFDFESCYCYHYYNNDNTNLKCIGKTSYLDLEYIINLCMFVKRKKCIQKNF